MSLEQFKDVDVTKMSKEQLFLYQKTLETELRKINEQYNNLSVSHVTYEDLIDKIHNLHSDNFSFTEPIKRHIENLIDDGYCTIRFHYYTNYKTAQPITGHLKIVAIKDQNGVITDIITGTLLIEMPKQLVIHNPKRLVTQSKLYKNHYAIDKLTLMLETTLGIGFITSEALKDIVETIVNDTTITYQ